MTWGGRRRIRRPSRCSAARESCCCWHCFGGVGLRRRLVVALACLPQLPYWADQLPLFLIPHGRREMQAMMLATLLGFLGWIQFARGPGDVIDSIRPFAIVCTYLPALVLVLRRPNVGALPASLERVVARLPESVRGVAPT